MLVKINPSWEKVILKEFEKEYYNNLMQFIEFEYNNFKCFPPISEVFAAFDYCLFENLKVVILGQDPYHGFGQANGLCFSVNDGVTFPPSLINIFKEIESDIGEPIPISGNLERWAKQGVLLLNATLSVRESLPGSHQKKGWEQFTDSVIKTISESNNNVVFLLWGSFAKNKIKLINTKNNFVLESGHPSPLSANRGFWFGNKHFSKTNEFLIQNGKTPIHW